LRDQLILFDPCNLDAAVPKASPSSDPDDPRPEPPIPPELEDCCNSGCNPCVFDLYENLVERYRTELAAWEARHANAEPKTRRTLRSDKPDRTRS
jgi:hypothetical protein